MKILLPAACLFIASAAAAGPSENGWDWRETPTPHFRIEHQDSWLAPGLTMGVERAFFRLRMDLESFSPWMSRERIGLYLYRDLETYVNGEFHPPQWSNGVAIYARRCVALPAMKETDQMLRIIAHETTHLLFVGYFREKRRDPPYWINEGLAMLEETDSSSRPERSNWYQAMVQTKPRDWFPMADFLSIEPDKDLSGDKQAIGRWYVQAYSAAYFLVRKHTRLQFQSFCSALRDGKSAAEALWLVYRYRSPAAFEKQWRAWLSHPAHRAAVAALPLSELDAGDGVVRKAAVWRSSISAFGDFQPLTMSSRAGRDRVPAP